MREFFSKLYLGKLLVEYKAHSIEELSNGMELFGNSKNYQKNIRFGDDKTKSEVENALESASKNRELYVQELLNNLKMELEAIDSQISTLQKNLYNSTENGEIVRLEKENKRLIEETKKLVGFKNRNEKKRYRTQ